MVALHQLYTSLRQPLTRTVINHISRPATITRMYTKSPIIPRNTLKEKIDSKQRVLGTFISEFRQPSSTQILSNAGFDWATIDNEHSQFSTETIADISRFAVLLGLTPIVRIPDHQYHHIAQSLDAGAQGLMVPRITDAAQMKKIVDMTRFPPLGIRGNALSRGYTQLKGGNVVDAMATSNDSLTIMCQIETAEAIENVDELAALDGVHVLLVGPNDLSIALGVAGDLMHEKCTTAIQKVIDACNKHGKCAAIHQNTQELCIEWLKRGMHAVSMSSEAGFMASAATNAAKALRDYKQ